MYKVFRAKTEDINMTKEERSRCKTLIQYKLYTHLGENCIATLGFGVRSED